MLVLLLNFAHYLCKRVDILILYKLLKMDMKFLFNFSKYEKIILLIIISIYFNNLFIDIMNVDAAQYASISQEMLRNRIAKVLKSLSYREREIIKLRYGLGDGYSYTLEEVGHIFKVTRERIRQIEAKAVRKLQAPARSEELSGFLD